jgi:SAM-dependent methyltransferase
MSENEKKSQFLTELLNSINENRFVKLTFSNYKGNEENLKNIYAKRIVIKNENKLSFTYRYKTKDIVKNYSVSEAIELCSNLLEHDFRICTLMTITNDFVFENVNSLKSNLRILSATVKELPSTSHDNVKNHKIGNVVGKKYMNLLELTDENGKVLAKSQDKFRQINHYIEILSSLLKELPKKEMISISDMGSGKGYLTFALYDYLTNELKLNAEITGVEFRKELVSLCNDISQKSGFEKLSFVEGEIESYVCEKLDIMIALHACNTATDDAIAKAIKADAKLIVVAPCCQHQIRQEIEKSQKVNVLSPIIKHGIFLERQSELITDGIRALIMEYFGYKTKVVEFISDAHTHKNVMIIGQKIGKNSANSEILKKIKDLKDMLGIEEHYLESKLLNKSNK